jgi:AraC-like DNA-binding protein
VYHAQSDQDEALPDFLELVLRGGAATTFLLLSFIFLRDGRNRTLAWLGALFCVCTIYWSLNTPQFLGWLDWWALPLVAIAYGKAAAFWLFSRALFDDGFKMKPLDWVILVGMMVFGGVWVTLGALDLMTEPVQIPHQIAQIVLAATAAWVAWKGRGADLVESRRRARIAFVLLSSLFMIGITLSYIAPGRPGPLVVDLNVLRMFVMGLGMAVLVAGLRSEEMFSTSGKTIAPATGEPKSVVVCTDPAEARLLTTLQRLMEEERVYREAGLTIGALASGAGAAEYVLRRLINGRLGYRNFNAYLNAWRLADAKAALQDPAQRDVPISTIALDAGFSSLGPFNRAFKAAEGMTPSEFRDGAPAETSNASPIVKSA